MNDESSKLLHPKVKPLLIILSGLSGVGKDVVLNGLRRSGYPLEFIITLTTRPQRPNEKDGTHYHFVSNTIFEELIQDNQLLEWANVYGNWYGVPREPVKQSLAGGKDTVIKIDVQGASTIKKILPQAVFIFLATPTMKELEQRLTQRRTETPSDLDLRLKTAGKELESLSMFDYLVFNRRDEIDRAIADVLSIISAEKCRVTPRELTL